MVRNVPIKDQKNPIGGGRPVRDLGFGGWFVRWRERVDKLLKSPIGGQGPKAAAVAVGAFLLFTPHHLAIDGEQIGLADGEANGAVQGEVFRRPDADPSVGDVPDQKWQMGLAVRLADKAPNFLGNNLRSKLIAVNFGAF